MTREEILGAITQLSDEDRQAIVGSLGAEHAPMPKKMMQAMMGNMGMPAMKEKMAEMMKTRPCIEKLDQLLERTGQILAHQKKAQG